MLIKLFISYGITLFLYVLTERRNEFRVKIAYFFLNLRKIQNIYLIFLKEVVSIYLFNSQKFKNAYITFLYIFCLKISKCRCAASKRKKGLILNFKCFKINPVFFSTKMYHLCFFTFIHVFFVIIQGAVCFL